LAQIIRIVHYFILSIETKCLANLSTPILYIVTAINIICLVNYNRLKGILSSGLLFMFWLLVSVASIPDIIDYSIIFYQQVKSVSLWVALISVWFHFFSAFGSFIATCFAEPFIVPEMTFDGRV
jgi:hypothetical protein